VVEDVELVTGCSDVFVEDAVAGVAGVAEEVAGFFHADAFERGFDELTWLFVLFDMG